MVALIISVASAQAQKSQVIAHRGYWKTAGSAQNSITALQKADSIHCYGSEFDVWLTKDNKLVIRPKDRSQKSIRVRSTEFTITTNSSSLKKADMAGIEVFNLNGKFASNEKVKFSTAGNTKIELRDTVTVDQMEVSTAGQATLNANALYARVFKGEIAGKGTFNLKGAGEKADFEIAGSGKVHAFDYELSTLSCEIAGKGLIETFAKDQIDAEIAGMGTVKYKGNPSVKVDKAGLGSVKKVD